MMKKLAAHDGSAVLILDRDRDRATVSASAFATANRLVMTGGDAVVGALVGRRMALSALVTEAQIAGQFSFDGLDAVAEVRKTVPSCRIVVTGEHLPDSVAHEAVRRGASDVVLRPFDTRDFRTRLGLGAAANEGMILHIPTVEEFIASESLSPAFQPIVDLKNTDRGVGFES